MKALITAALFFALSPPPVLAQARNACGPRDLTVQRLAEKYGETLQSIGLTAAQTILEVYASEKSGSWTILVSRANGVTCLLASGQMWETKAIPLGPVGEPS